ncbi:hypothetical protein NTGM5_300032 [Candidatus Nitrotoga sp. M5]|nr:hypothetical protein NTGM5_300032 [Candidatus Nitrotoga sp. M5]
MRADFLSRGGQIRTVWDENSLLLETRNIEKPRQPDDAAREIKVLRLTKWFLKLNYKSLIIQRV